MREGDKEKMELIFSLKKQKKKKEKWLQETPAATRILTLCHTRSKQARQVDVVMISFHEVSPSTF